MFERMTAGTTASSEIRVYPRFCDGTVRAGYTFRRGGVSTSPYESLNLGFHVGDEPEDVVSNRVRVAQNGFGDISEWVVARQVHGNSVTIVGAIDKGRGALSDESAMEDCDGLITNEPDITLVVLVADCVPVLFYDPVHKAIGVAHSGWRGTTQHVVQQVILHMNFFYETKASDVQVSIGPSIRQCCYEVDEKVAEPVAAQFGPAVLQPRFGKPGKYLLSLQSCVKQDLLAMGVNPQNIDDTGICTSCHTDLLFSHRAEHGHTGRQCGLIRLDGKELQAVR